MLKLFLPILGLIGSSAFAVTLSVPTADLVGSPGQIVGWGYSILNDTGSFMVVTSVQSTYQTHPSGVSFNNPALDDLLSVWMIGHGVALSGGCCFESPFLLSSGLGLGSLQIAAGASGTEFGTILVNYSLFDANPFTNPNANQVFPLNDAGFVSVSTSVTVTPLSNTPEPASAALLGGGLLVLAFSRPKRRWTGSLAMLLAVPFLLPAQTCNVSGVPLTIRAEGQTELLGDLLLSCQGPSAGFVPTPLGQPVPRVNFRIALYADAALTRPLALANRVTNISVANVAAQAVDAVLVIESFSFNPSLQRACAASEALANACALTGVYNPPSNPSGINFGNPSGNVRTVYQGLKTAANTVTFLNVPFEPTSDILDTARFRAKNFRLAVAGSTLASNGLVFAKITLENAPSAILPSTLAGVGFVQESLRSPAGSIASLPRCVDNNAALALSATASVAPQGTSLRVRLDEPYPNAFKVRGFVPGNSALDQKDWSQIYSTESGFFSTLFPLTDGLNRAGAAQSGTRFRMLFDNIPAGVELYAPVDVPIPGSRLPSRIRMVDSDATASGAPTAADLTAETSTFLANTSTALGGLRRLSTRGAFRFAVYEAVAVENFSHDSFEVPITVAYAANTPQVISTATVSFAPYDTAPVSGSALIPTFGGTPITFHAFTIGDCSVCGVKLNTSIAGKTGTFTNSTWAVRVTNNGLATATGGVINFVVTKTGGNGTIASYTTTAAIPAIAGGASAIVNLQIASAGTDGSTFVSLRMTVGAGCMPQTPQNFAFQKLR